MTTVHKIAEDLIDEAIAARAHFQVWWTLRNLALPRHLSTMNDFSYVDFFHASNAGHYKLFLLALSKIYDRHPQAGGMQALRAALKAGGHVDLAQEIEVVLRPFHPQIRSVDGIRNKSLVHNEKGVPRGEVYQQNGVTPDELSALIEVTGQIMNRVAGRLAIPNTVFTSDRLQRATMSLLERLSHAGA